MFCRLQGLILICHFHLDGLLAESFRSSTGDKLQNIQFLLAVLVARSCKIELTKIR